MKFNAYHDKKHIQQQEKKINNIKIKNMSYSHKKNMQLTKPHRESATMHFKCKSFATLLPMSSPI